MSSFSSSSEQSTLSVLPHKSFGYDFLQEGTVFRPYRRIQEKEKIEVSGDLSDSKVISRSVFVLRNSLLVLSLLLIIQFVLAFFNLAIINGFISLLAGVLLFGLFDVINKAIISFKSNG